MFLGGEARTWAKTALDDLNVEGYVIGFIVPEVAGALAERVIPGLATAWVLWRYVAVHRAPATIEAPARST